MAAGKTLTNTENTNTVRCENKKIGDKFNHKGNMYLVVDDESINDLANFEELQSGNIRFCTSHVTSMNGLFQGDELIQPITDWDVSNVYSMRLAPLIH